MSKTILVAGYGIGISAAVAELFGSRGYAVALVARSQERAMAGVKELQAKGIRAAAFAADVSDPKASVALAAKVKAELGPIGAVHFNAYLGDAGDVLEADPEVLGRVVNVAVVGLTGLVQAALPDLKEAKGSVLVTNGGLGLLDAGVEGYTVQGKTMGLAIANAAKHKLVRLLNARLKADGVYVGEVMVTTAVKGTSWDNGSATLEASTVAEKFWQLHSERRELSVLVP